MIIFKNFWHAVRTYRMAFALNIGGLAIAFTVFYLLMVQVLYEWHYNRCFSDSDRIYRLEVIYGDEMFTTVSIPVLDRFIKHSPNIEAGVIFVNELHSQIKSSTNESQDYVTFNHYHVTRDFCKVFDLELLQGDTTCLHNPEKALIPLSLARTLFGEKKSYLGEYIDGKGGWRLEVRGVYKDLPSNSEIKNGIFQLVPDQTLTGWLSDNSEWSFIGYTKLRQGTDPKQLAEKFNTTQDETLESNQRAMIHLISLNDSYFLKRVIQSARIENGDFNMMVLLFSIAVLILVVSSINFMNFSSALIPLRIRSVNIQKILGGSRILLRISFLFEAASLAFIAYLLAMLIVCLLSRITWINVISDDVWPIKHLALTLGTLLIALTSGVLSGLYPACYITSFQPAMVLKGSFGLSSHGKLLSRCLIGLQFVGSLVAITLAGFMMLQHYYLLHSDAGFNRDTTFQLELTDELRIAQNQLFENRLRANPMIEDIAYSEMMSLGNLNHMGWGRMFREKQQINFKVIPVSPNFLDVMGIKVNEGRTFTVQDQEQEMGVLIFNQAAKNKYQLELGETIPYCGNVIGFIPDIKFAGFKNAVGPFAFYVWGKQNYGRVSYLASIRMSNKASRGAIKKFIDATCKEIDPKFSSEIIFAEDSHKRLYQKEEHQTQIVLVFSFLVIFVAILGVFGLVSFEVQARRKEVGVRKVFGASFIQILALFNRRYLYLVITSFILSLPLSWWTTNIWLQSFAYHTPIHLWVFLLSFVIVSGVVVVTVTGITWRTANENPIDALNR